MNCTHVCVRRLGVSIGPRSVRLAAPNLDHLLHHLELAGVRGGPALQALRRQTLSQTAPSRFRTAPQPGTRPPRHAAGSGLSLRCRRKTEADDASRSSRRLVLRSIAQTDCEELHRRVLLCASVCAKLLNAGSPKGTRRWSIFLIPLVSVNMPDEPLRYQNL